MLASIRDSPIRSRLVLLIGQSFSFGLTLALLIIAASAIFLSAFGSGRLPYTYIAVALLGALIAYGLTALQRRWTIPQLSLTTIVFLLVLFISCWFALSQAQARWVSFVLLVVFSLYLQIGFVFIGGQAGRLLDVRQIKRYFPRIVSGFAAGFLVGGLIAVPLVDLFGRTEDLLLAATGTGLLLLAFQVSTGRRFPEELGRPVADSQDQPRRSLRRLLTRRFVALVFIYQLLTAMGGQLLDFMVFDQAAQRFAGSATLAQFLGNYTWILNLVDILFLALLAGYLLNRFGLRFGLGANPGLMGLLALSILAIGSVQGTASILFFVLVAAARILNIALNDGTTRTSINAAYQAMPPADRLAVQTGVEGMGVPLALGVTGLILLIYNALPGLNILHLTIFVLLITLAWLAVGMLVFRDYSANLLKNLKRRILGEADLTIADASTLAVIERLVASAKIREVRLGLDMLIQAEHADLPVHLSALLARPEPPVQVEALQRVEAGRFLDLLPAIQAVLKQDANPQVTGAALRALAALRGADSVADLLPYADDARPAVRRDALVGLLRDCSTAGEAAAQPRLGQLGSSPDPVRRRLLAEILENSRRPDLVGLLRPLLEDEDRGVRQAGLLAAQHVPDAQLLPLVAENLDDPATRSAAIAALAAAGTDLLPLVEAALQAPESPRSLWLIRACRQVEPQSAIALLHSHIRAADPDLRTELLSTLAACDYQVEAQQRSQVVSAFRQEAEFALTRLVAQADLGDDSKLQGLQRALSDELRSARHRMFCLLSFLYDSQGMRRAASRLRRNEPQERALALEVLDVTLESNLKGIALPSLDPEISPADCIRALSRHFPVRHLGRTACLEEIIENGEDRWPSRWTRLCAVHAAQQLGEPALAAPEKEDPMLLTIEKVAILNNLEIFLGTPDHVLAAVAQIMEEVELEPGETLIEEGAIEACMYIVVDGKVRVHSNDQTILVLEPGQTVGELAVFDPGPRAASVTAVEPTLLFRLERDSLDEVMADRPEIARGVIRTLARRIREEGKIVAGSQATL